eukprot:181843_1
MNAGVALVLTITCIIIVCLLLWSDSNITEMTLNQKEDAIKMLSQNQSIYSVLFTTPRYQPLIATPGPTILINHSMSFNKTIWICWFQGWNSSDIHPLIQQNLKSWKYYNEKDKWNIILLDKYNLAEYMDNWQIIYDEFTENKFTMAALSDVVRIILLNKYGGMWVDSSVFCNQRLNEWVLTYIENKQFFAFSHPTKNKLIASWFLYSPNNGSNNYIINKWYQEIMKFWFTGYRNNNYSILKSPNNLDYYWVHQLFKDCYTNDEKFKKIWDVTQPKIEAEYTPQQIGPHFLVSKYWRHINDHIRQHIDQKQASMYKLTRHLAKNKFTDAGLDGTVIQYLFSTIPNIVFL